LRSCPNSIIDLKKLLCRNHLIEEESAPINRKSLVTVSPYLVMVVTCKETIKRSTGRYFWFVETALPFYSCKYSKKLYTQPQLLALIFFKDYLKKDYREIIDLIVEMDRIQNLLGLITIPHFPLCKNF
jgi:hypothetical protein